MTEFLGGFDPMSGIYLTGPNGPTIVAFEDTAAPIAGKYFRSFLSGSIVVNGPGQMAFMAELSDTVNGAAAGHGLFFYDPDSGLQQVVRFGDELNGSTITNVYFNGAVNGSGSFSPDTSLSGLNHVGQVAFAFALANGQEGVAIFSPTSVPGDYNGDKQVDSGDYHEWQLNFGAAASDADGNVDGTTDAADYVVWRKFADQPGGGAADLNSPAVPESTAIALITIGAAVMNSWRNRRGRAA
jgi:hypothetical protein